MCSKAIILVCLACVYFVDSSLAPFITKCKWDDSKCLKENAQKSIPLFADGIPELNMERIDPMTLKYVDASTSTIKLIVSDVVVTGLKSCEPKKIERDLEKNKLFVKFLCSCELHGKYVMNGQLLIIPIEGNGALETKIPKIVISVEVDLKDDIGEDGKKHWGIKQWKHTFALKDKSDVKFENLFPGNELLRETTNALIAENGNDVIIETGAPIIKAVVAKVIETVLNFFKAVSLDDLVLD